MLLRAGFYKTKGVTLVHLILALCLVLALGLAVMLPKTKLDYVLSNNLDVSDKKISKTALCRYTARDDLALQPTILKRASGLVSKCQAKKYNAIITHATIVCICNALIRVHASLGNR